jgi:hypothetical protein
MVTDSVVFVVDGIQQDVDLAACGWDAILLSHVISGRSGVLFRHRMSRLPHGHPPSL